ncbi:SagB/ThcOx family dehydrogenase [Thermococcus thioreducens]|uniref:Nitroreductase n=1 Tax=Thermococcus thioreducens TaxID=277988 RepID=A0A0Q2XK05_9EURY|nr:SagB/ThcOx family dehydrogenase [Thermococcus thioreducens]ASJ13445.1 nitroreductase [Thermococcus thioreducens]KQH81428.1 nitroreductase [Thermococcus thioreducens]SEV97199.1 SagB-type dehydrogenase domain-containing protein [Thermococcus thioreducens]
MNFRHVSYIVVALVVASSLLLVLKPYVPLRSVGETVSGDVIALPEPRLESEISVEEAIARRRSIRSYRDEPVTLRQLSQLLWAAQGITAQRTKFRASPSAGATYPFEVYVVAGNVEGLAPGVYRYDPFNHTLVSVKPGDYRKALQDAALDQRWVGDAPLSLVLVAFYERTTSRYGERGIRYVHMEAGHIGQNIYLQATALGLGTVAVGAFYDEQVAEILGTDGAPLYIFPVGVPNG